MKQVRNRTKRRQIYEFTASKIPLSILQIRFNAMICTINQTTSKKYPFFLSSSSYNMSFLETSKSIHCFINKYFHKSVIHL